jgi:serine/threonine protein kinase
MDMKIENLMLDSQGHVRIVDFGLAVKIPPDAAAAAAAATTTTTTATAATATHEDSGQDGQRRGGGFPIDAVGSLMSAAPELLLGKDEGRVGGCFSDWWAVGVLAHDLLTGKSPWSSLIKKDVIRQEIKTRHVQISKSSVSLAARQFVEGLLAKDWRERLGTRSSDEVLASLFFEGVDWGAVERGDTPPVLGTQPGDREFPGQPRELGFALDEYKQKRRMASAAAGALPSRSSSLDPNPMSVGLLYVAKPPPVFASR